jgi:hypothetical protein
MDPCQTVTYTYDQILEFSSQANGIGRLTGVNWYSQGCAYGFSENYAYTAAGKLYLKWLTMLNPNGGQPVVLQGGFGYDSEGRLSAYTPDSQRAMHYWTAIYDSGANTWKYWGYNPSGQAFSLVFAYWELRSLSPAPQLYNWDTLKYQGYTWTPDAAGTNCHHQNRYRFRWRDIRRKWKHEATRRRQAEWHPEHRLDGRPRCSGHQWTIR